MAKGHARVSGCVTLWLGSHGQATCPCARPCVNTWAFCFEILKMQGTHGQVTRPCARLCVTHGWATHPCLCPCGSHSLGTHPCPCSCGSHDRVSSPCDNLTWFKFQILRDTVETHARVLNHVGKYRPFARPNYHPNLGHTYKHQTILHSYLKCIQNIPKHAPFNL